MIHSTENVIRHKVGLLNLAEELQNVSRACKVMGVSRDLMSQALHQARDGRLHILGKMQEELAAHRAGRESYLCVATAASMDGYTAFGASITHEGAKQTFSCPAPRAVVADLDGTGAQAMADRIGGPAHPMFGAMLLEHGEPALLDELIEPRGGGGAGARIGVQPGLELGLAQQIAEIDPRAAGGQRDRRLDPGLRDGLDGHAVW